MATILIADHRRSPSPASRYLPIYLDQNNCGFTLNLTQSLPET